MLYISLVNEIRIDCDYREDLYKKIKEKLKNA